MDANIEQIEKRFNFLKKNFDDRYNKSEDKETLLKSEIDSHEMLFGYMKLPANIDPFTSFRPLKNLVYSINEIQSIRGSL
jgi:hypothetical protein